MEFRMPLFGFMVYIYIYKVISSQHLKTMGWIILVYIR